MSCAAEAALRVIARALAALALAEAWKSGSENAAVMRLTAMRLKQAIEELDAMEDAK